MSDEPVDSADESGVVVCRVMKSEAHEQGLLRACVVSEVIVSRNRPRDLRPARFGVGRFYPQLLA